MKEDRKNNAERDAVQTILSGKYKRSLTFKLVCFSAFFVITALTCIVGVWAAQRVSITTSGSISYVATDVNATITGTISGSQTNPSLSTLTYTATSEPTSAELATWQDLDLKFKANAEDVAISITIKNNSTERKLNYTIADTVATSSNLSKTISGGNSGEIGFGESKVITITFKVIDKNKSVENTSFNYVVRLNDPSYTQPAGGFLMTGEKWQQKIKDTIPGYTNSAVTSISFTKTRPTTGTPVSVGACDEGGTTPYSAAAALPTTKDVTAYVTETDGSYSIVFHCTETIYAPTDSSYLFSNREFAWYYAALFAGVNIDETITSDEVNSEEFQSQLSTDNIFQTLSSLDLSNFNSSLSEKTKGMFALCMTLEMSQTITDKISINSAKDISGMFIGVSKLAIDFDKFDTSNVIVLVAPFYAQDNSTVKANKIKLSRNATNISGLFAGCNLENLDLSKFDTSNITDMSGLFAQCDITSLDLSKLNTSNVTNMSHMFEGCKISDNSKTYTITLDTSKVTNMHLMFGSSNFTKLILNFDTSNVENMSYMFNGCTSLSSVDLSSFRTTKLQNVERMFAWGPDYGSTAAAAITEIDLSNFDLSNASNLDNMFDQCLNLTKIKAPSKLSKNMNLSSIGVGGSNSTWKIEGDTSGTTYTEITATNGTLGKTLIKVS